MKKASTYSDSAMLSTPARQPRLRGRKEDDEQSGKHFNRWRRCMPRSAATVRTSTLNSSPCRWVSIRILMCQCPLVISHRSYLIYLRLFGRLSQYRWLSHTTGRQNRNRDHTRGIYRPPCCRAPPPHDSDVRRGRTGGRWTLFWCVTKTSSTRYASNGRYGRITNVSIQS